MRIEDEGLLDEFGTEGECECCGCWCSRREAHHVWCKGMGGAFRLDVRINLASLCLLCHRLFHDGNLPKIRIIVIVANRENVTPQFVISEVERLRWAPTPKNIL